MTNSLETLIASIKPIGSFVHEPSGRRWHHIKHGEYQSTEPKLTLVKLYSEDVVSSLIAALEQVQQESNVKSETIASVVEAWNDQRDRAAELEHQWEHRAPTQWAYDQACTALHAQRERAETAEQRIAELEAAVKPVKLPGVAAVVWNLSAQAKHRTSAENVRDVIEAIRAAGIQVEGE